MIEVIPIIGPMVDVMGLARWLPERRLLRTLDQARQAPDQLVSVLAVLDSLVVPESTFTKSAEQPLKVVLQQLHFGFLVKAPRVIIHELIMIFGSSRSIVPEDRECAIVTTDLSQWIELLKAGKRPDKLDEVFNLMRQYFSSIGFSKMLR